MKPSLVKKYCLPIYLVLVVNFGFTQTMDWRSLSKELNGTVSTMVVYKDKLIVGGDFVVSDSNSSKSIAEWDGVKWSSLSIGITGKLSKVNEMKEFQNSIFIVGIFDSAGSVQANNVAKWDGNSWTNFGTTCNGEIYEIEFFNNELYVAGLFDSIGGVAANRVAKWDGTKWNALGSSIKGNGPIFDLCNFNSELYVLGTFDTAGIIPCKNIAKWNGINWDSVSFGVETEFTSMVEYNGKLLIGSGYTTAVPEILVDMFQWDGKQLKLFSRQDMRNIVNLSVLNDQLYCSGIVVSKWDSIKSGWVILGRDSKTFLNRIYSLVNYRGELYCGGAFNKLQGAKHNYIAKYTDITGISKHQKNHLAATFYPIPFLNKFTIDIQSSAVQYPLQFSVFDVLGKKVYTSVLLKPKTEIEDFSHKGVFYWSLMDNTQNLGTGKLITE